MVKTPTNEQIAISALNKNPSFKKSSNTAAKEQLIRETAFIAEYLLSIKKTGRYPTDRAKLFDVLNAKPSNLIPDNNILSGLGKYAEQFKVNRSGYSFALDTAIRIWDRIKSIKVENPTGKNIKSKPYLPDEGLQRESGEREKWRRHYRS